MQLAGLICGAAAATPKNVLFIAVDDMRPDIGAFNFSLAHTPNLDRLGATGTIFKRAYVQYAFCAPSRNSFMSGRRPDTTRVWNFHDHFREEGVGAEWATLPQYFKNNGFVTMGSGKLFHPMLPPDNDWPNSWSALSQTENVSYYSPECMPPACPNSRAPGAEQSPYSPNGAYHCVSADPVQGFTLCAANTSKDESRFMQQLEGQRIRDSCLGQLEVGARAISRAAAPATGFFVGCGFHKPHVPWIFPAEFLHQFPANLSDIPLASDPFAPVGMPDVAWHYPADVHGMGIQFNGTCNETRARNYRRGYYAAIAYTDYNIGQLLDKLDDLGVAASTAVIVFGDHGWQLGEHDTWSKMTNFEVALRIPLIIRAPWFPNSVGVTTSVLAEAVDFYPTLAGLVGLPDPKSAGPASAGINGTDLTPVFRDPVANAALKDAAYSQFAKPSVAQPFAFWPTPARNATNIMGYSVRVDAWRYTAWFRFDNVTITPMTHAPLLGRELYDHHGDTGLLDWKGEHVNVAEEAANADVVETLHAKILDYIQLFPVHSA